MNKRMNETLPKAGRMIQGALDKKGWTQNKLATITGMPTPVINQYISGRRLGINPRQIVRIAFPLGLDPHELAIAFVSHSVDIEVAKLLDKIKTWASNEEDEK